LEQERQDQEPVAVELDSEAQGPGARVVLDQVAEDRAEVNLAWGRDQEGRVPWLEVPVVSGRGRADRA